MADHLKRGGMPLHDAIVACHESENTEYQGAGAYGLRGVLEIV